MVLGKSTLMQANFSRFHDVIFKRIGNYYTMQSYFRSNILLSFYNTRIQLLFRFMSQENSNITMLKKDVFRAICST